MGMYVDFTREALDSLGAAVRELPGPRFARFVTESISAYAGLAFYVLVSERYGIVKIVAYSPNLRAEDGAGPFQGTVVPRESGGERRVVKGLLVGWRALRQPQTVESIVAGLDDAARALIGDQSDFEGLRQLPCVSRRGSTESREEVSASRYSSLDN